MAGLAKTLHLPPTRTGNLVRNKRINSPQLRLQEMLDFGKEHNPEVNLRKRRYRWESFLNGNRMSWRSERQIGQGGLK
jgi:hypothetical protein